MTTVMEELHLAPPEALKDKMSFEQRMQAKEAIEKLLGATEGCEARRAEKSTVMEAVRQVIAPAADQTKLSVLHLEIIAEVPAKVAGGQLIEDVAKAQIKQLRSEMSKISGASVETALDYLKYIVAAGYVRYVRHLNGSGGHFVLGENFPNWLD